MSLTVRQIKEAEHEVLSNPSRGRKHNGKARSHSKSGLIGAFQCGGYGKWKSRIRVNGRVITVRSREGKTYFHSPEEAHEAYIEACMKFGINLSL